MKAINICYPEVDPVLFYGKIIKWEFRSSLISIKNGYAYRFTLFFENGKSKEYQKSGFKTKKEAELSKGETISSLYSKTFIPFRVKTTDFCEYWLYYYMIDEKHIAYNTYYSYKNIIYNYIFKAIDVKKTKIKLSSLKESDINKVILYLEKQGKSESLKRSAISVISGILQYAQYCQCIAINPAENFLKGYKIKKRKSRKKKTKREAVILSMEQSIMLINTCSTDFPTLYIPLLLALTAGLRMGEVLGIRYKDVDFSAKTVTVKGQIGSTLEKKGKEEKMATHQYIPPKTHNSIREVYIPQFVCIEILKERKRYYRLKETVPGFYDLGYISCQSNGKPLPRKQVRNDFQTLLQSCGLPPMHFHDLRHTYATLLDSSGISEKLISNMLGHARENFTRQTYIDERSIPRDLTTDICDIASDIMPTF